MKMTNDVTARPWKCERGWLRGANNERIAEFFSHPNFDDQQFLVRAVNSHDDLVATLQWLRDNYAAGRTLEINERIDAALAKATA